MKGLRTVVSAVAILMGSALVVTWFGALLLLRAVDDGAVARTLASAALSTPAVTDQIGKEILVGTAVSLERYDIDLSELGIDAQLREAFADLARSDEFKALVLAKVDDAHAQLRQELALKERPRGPFVIAVDVSPAVNQQLGAIPFVGPSLGDVEMAPVEVELVSASAFDDARTGYARVELAKRFFLWAAVAFLATGLAVSTRRWLVIPKFVISVGAMACAAAALLVLVTPARIADALPGGESSTWGRLVSETIANDSLPGIQRSLAWGGLAALVIGVVFFLVVRTLRRARH